jgi:hypothetical protein
VVKRSSGGCRAWREVPGELREGFCGSYWENLGREAAATFLPVHCHAGAIGARGQRFKRERVPAGLSNAICPQGSVKSRFTVVICNLAENCTQGAR